MENWIWKEIQGWKEKSNFDFIPALKIHALCFSSFSCISLSEIVRGLVESSSWGRDVISCRGGVTLRANTCRNITQYRREVDGGGKNTGPGVHRPGFQSRFCSDKLCDLGDQPQPASSTENEETGLTHL